MSTGEAIAKFPGKVQVPWQPWIPRTSDLFLWLHKPPIYPVFQDVEPPDLSDFAVVSPSQIAIIAGFIAYKCRYDD